MHEYLTIRAACESDAGAISELALGHSHYFFADPSGTGAEYFLSSISEAAIAAYIADPRFNYVVGLLDDRVMAAAALRDNGHVYHLFVHPASHRRGIAARLWQRLKSEAVASGNPGVFTVNSSLYAVAVYARFGFKPTDEEAQTKSGIRFQPMQLLCADYGKR